MTTVDTFEPGVPGIYNIPAEVYHAAPGLSNSMVSNMSPPARLPAYLTGEREVTPEMVMGTLIHQRILEPGRPMPKIAVYPEEYAPGKKWHMGSKVCQEWDAAARKAGKIPMKADKLDDLIGCIDAIRANTVANALFSSPGVSELSMFTEADGVLLKSRLDFVPPREVCKALCDLKKVQKENAEREAFIKLAVNRGYHRQAAAYIDAWNYWFPDDQRETMLFIVVEEQAPHLVNIIPMGSRTIDAGRRINAERRALYKRCLAENVWPGYPQSLIPIEASDWLLEQDL